LTQRGHLEASQITANRKSGQRVSRLPPKDCPEGQQPQA
jgi:hypothetical protein